MKTNSKTNLKKKIMLALLAGGMLYAGTAAAAFNLNLMAQTDATGKTYSTGGITKTTVSQATKDGDITLGQTINFGNYQQSIATGSLTEDGSAGSNHDQRYKENGTVTYNTENVNWIVVKDNGSNKYTLVSTKILDQHIFDSTSQKWSESSMRTWMNDTMLNTMLSAREQNLLQSQNTITYSPTESGTTGYNGWDDSTNTNADKGYNTTTGDKLWLLSVQELHEYFKNDVDTNPTYGTGGEYPSGSTASGKVPWGAGVSDYAKSRGIWVETDGGVTAVDGSNNANYILRSPSTHSTSYVRTSYDYGAVPGNNVTTNTYGVRPALQLNLSSLLFTSVGGERNATGVTTIKGKYAGSGTYEGTKFVEAGCSQAAKFEQMTESSILDLTFYDEAVSQSGLTANTTLELGADGMFKLGYTGANTAYDIAGMIATGTTSGYTPVGWGKMALAGSTSGTMGIGFDNIDAGDYSLHIMGEEGTGTSFVGDTVLHFYDLKRTASGLELDLTTTGNTAKTFSGAITVTKNNKLTANITQLTGNAGISNGGDIILKGSGTLNHKVSKNGSDVGTLTVNDGAITFAPTADDALDNFVTIKNGATLTAHANVFNQTVTAAAGGTAVLKDGTLDAQITGAGNLTVDGTVTTNADNIATTGTNTVNAGKTLKINAGTLAQNLVNNGTTEFLASYSSTLGGDITGTGTTVVTGTLNNSGNKNITQNALTITATTGNLTTDADMLNINSNNGTITNNGTLTFNAAGTLEEKIEGSGTLKITTAKTIVTNTIDNIVDIASDGTLEAKTTGKLVGGASKGITNAGIFDVLASNVGGDVTNTGGTTNLYAGTLGKKITGGNINIKEDVTTDADNIAGTVALGIDSGKTLTLSGNGTSSSPDILASTVTLTNSGTLKIDTGKYVKSEAILNGNIDNDGNLTAAAEKLGTATVDNAGTLNVLAGTMDNAVIKGGTVNLQGVVKVKGTNFDATSQVQTLNIGISGTAGTLDLSNSSTDEIKIGKLAAASGAKICLDVDLSTATATAYAGTGSVTESVVDVSKYDHIITTGVATGTIGLESINLTAAATDSMEIGSYVHLKVVDVGTTAGSDLTFGDSVSVTSNGYKYTFGQAYQQPKVTTSTKKMGYLQVEKDNGYTLYEIVTTTNGSGDGYDLGKVGTYSILESTWKGNGNTGAKDKIGGSNTGTLGELGAGASSRTTFTIQGNGNNFDAGAANTITGITVPSGMTLNLNGIGEIKNWKTYAVDNAGTVNIDSSGTSDNATTLSSVLKGAGTYNNTGTLISGDAANLTMTGTFNNSGTVKIGNSTESELGATITGGIVDITGKVKTAADKINGADTVKTESGTTLTVTAGGLTKNITNDGTTNMQAGSSFGTDGKITGGDVTLGSGVVFSASNLSGTSTLNANGATYKIANTFDFSSATPVVPAADIINVSTQAKGTITLDSVSVTGRNDAWAIGTSKEMSYINGGSGNTIQITNTQTADSEGFLYTFENGSTAGKMKVTKSVAAFLWQIVQNDDGTGNPLVSSNPINTYSLNSDYTETHDLGNLTEVPSGTAREFSIEGNGKKFLGGGHEGITVGNGDTLNLNNISEIANWAPAAVTNNGGTLNLNKNGGTTNLKSKITGTGTFNNCPGSTLNVDDASYLDMGTDGINNSGTINLKEGILGAKINGGTMNVSGGTVTSNADYICGDNNVVAEDGKLILNPGTLTKPITNNGTVELAGINSPLEQAITGGTLDINQDLTSSADNIKGDKNIVEEGKTLTLNGGNISKIIEGPGNLTIDTDMTLNADNIVTTGTNKIGSGKTVSVDSGTLKVDFAGEEDSTLAITGEVASRGNRNIACGIIFKTGSTFKVNASDITFNPAVKGFSSALIEPGAKLYVDGASAGQQYKILGGNSNIDVQGWATDDDMGSNFKARFGLKVDVENTTGLGSEQSEFVIQFIKDETAVGGCDIPNIIDNLPESGKMTDWVNAFSAKYEDTATQQEIVNTAANMGSLANIQHGTWEMNNLAMDEVFDYMNTDSRPMARYDDSVLQNTAFDNPYNSRGGIKAEPVKVGKAKDIQPEKVDKIRKPKREFTGAYSEKYAKNVWATYIHSKETIDGLKTGSVVQNSTLKYDGATVGADLWSSSRGFGGIALTYADGNNTSSHNICKVRNDIDYYGVNAYNRTDIGIFSLQYDIGYTKSKNDIKMQTPAIEDVKAKADVNAYSAGLRVETPIVFSRATSLIPFAGVRYVHLKTDNYHNSIGLNYNADKQNIFSVPLGVTFRMQYEDSSGWRYGFSAEGGMKFNYGDRDSRQNITYTNVNDGVDFDIADKHHWFAKFGLQAANDRCVFEVGYRYSKSDKIKDNKYFVNLNFKF